MVDMQTWFGIQQLYADYASAVDSGKWNLWPEFFTEQCIYKLQPRENHERGFPLATLTLTSKGMLKDRATHKHHGMQLVVCVVGVRGT